MWERPSTGGEKKTETRKKNGREVHRKGKKGSAHKPGDKGRRKKVGKGVWLGCGTLVGAAVALSHVKN